MKDKFEKIAGFEEVSEPGPELLPWKQYMKFYASKYCQTSSILLHNFSNHSIEYIKFPEKFSISLCDLETEFSDEIFWKVKTTKRQCQSKFNEIKDELPSSFAWLLSISSLLTELPEFDIFFEMRNKEKIMCWNSRNVNYFPEINLWGWIIRERIIYMNKKMWTGVS